MQQTSPIHNKFSRTRIKLKEPDLPHPECTEIHPYLYHISVHSGCGKSGSFSLILVLENLLCIGNVCCMPLPRDLLLCALDCLRPNFLCNDFVYKQ